MKIISLILAVIIPCTWYAKDILILNDSARYQGALMGITQACVYFQDTSGSMVSISRDRIRSLMRDNKDITSSLTTAPYIISKDVYAFFPADSTSFALNSKAASLPPSSNTTLSAHLLLPLWIIAGASVISLFATKKVKAVQ